MSDNPQKTRQFDTEKVANTVRTTARELANNPVAWDNYLNSCIKHGGELAAIAQLVKHESMLTY
jgi:hypothetical protein